MRLALLVQRPAHATEIRGARRWALERLSQEVREQEAGRGANRPAAGISAALGYESEGAFRKAFKRITGAPPKKLTRTKKFWRLIENPINYGGYDSSAQGYQHKIIPDGPPFVARIIGQFI